MQRRNVFQRMELSPPVLEVEGGGGDEDVGGAGDGAGEGDGSDPPRTTKTGCNAACTLTPREGEEAGGGRGSVSRPCA